jgi:DNA repair exonuclease SbcCD ATPase subunit
MCICNTSELMLLTMWSCVLDSIGQDESQELMEQVERDHEKKVKELQNDLWALQQELEDSKVAAAVHLSQLQREICDSTSRAETAEASLSAEEANQRHLDQITRELEGRLKKAEETASRTTAELEAKEASFRRSVKERLHELSQDTKKTLIEIHKCVYKTESVATDVEVEFAKYSTHLCKTHRIELAALERNLFTTTSKMEV